KEAQIMNYIEETNFRYNGKQLYMKLDADEDVYEFLYTILPALDEYVELYLSSAIQHMLFTEDSEPVTEVKVDASTNLLEIGFDISGVAEDEVEKIIQAVMEKKHFYRLKSRAIMSLEDEAYTSIEC